MSKISITFAGDTIDELYSTVATFMSGRSLAVAVTDSGNLKAQVTSAAPAEQAEPGEVTSTDEFDRAGIPWDARIHASTRGVNQDGTWKRRRNTDDVYYASIMAELAQRVAGQQPSAPPAAPAAPASPAPVGIVDNGPVVIPPVPAAPATVPATPAPPMAAPVAAAPAIPPAPAAAVPAVPEAPAAPVAAPVTEAPAPVPVGGMQFKDFMPRVSAAINAGKFDNNALKGYLQQWGLTDITQLATDPTKVEAFYNWLKTANLID